MKKLLLVLLALPLMGQTFPPDGDGGWQVKKITLTSAQILALHTTPVLAIKVGGANCAPLIWGWWVEKPAGTAYVVDAADDIVLETADDNTTYATLETTGFLDQTTVQRDGQRIGAGALTNDLFGQNIQFNIGGQVITGDSPLYWTIVYHNGCVN